MRAVSSQLMTLLTTAESFWMADLYMFAPIGQLPVRLISGDADVKIGSDTWSAAGPRIERGNTRLIVGLEVDNLEITLHATPSHLLAGVPWLDAIRRGVLDGADVTLLRAFAPAPGEAITGTIKLFAGRVGDCELGRTSARLSIDSHLKLLNAPVPRNAYQSGCLNTVYDSACGLDRASREVIVSVTSVNGDVIGVSPAIAAGWFAAGPCRFGGSSGANAGRSVSIRSNTSNTITLLNPFPVSLQVGNTLYLAPGCNKTMDACNQLNNIVRFRGQPFVPVPETLL